MWHFLKLVTRSFSVHLFCLFVVAVVVFCLFLFRVFCFCFVVVEKSNMLAFLKTSSTTAVNSLGERGSPCLSPLFMGNSSDIHLFKWILAVAWLSMFYKVFTCFVYVSLFQGFKDGKVFYCAKGFHDQ